MDIRALVEGDLLAAQIGDGFERTVLRDQDRLALRGRRIVGKIDQRRAGSLRKDRRRFAGDAEIDRADIERFEERRSRRKFGPGHGVTERLQLLLQRSASLQEDQLAVFLETDAHDLVLTVGGTDASGDNAERQNGARDPALHKMLHNVSLALPLETIKSAYCARQCREPRPALESGRA